MEQPDQFNKAQNPSYWVSVGTAALIFGIITFLIETFIGYAVISGSGGFVFSIITGAIVCLIGAFAGMLAVWHYANEYDITMKLGKGALIGFFTGAALVIISTVLMQVWLLIDPDYTQQMVEATMARLETMDIPDEQLDAMGRAGSNQSIGWGVLFEFLIFGILNLLTGMLGVQLFAKEVEDY